MPILDKLFLRYGWYRNWQAKRSRKRLDKLGGLPSYKEAEGYESGIAEREQKRHEQLIARRKQQDAERQAEEKRLADLMDKAETQAKLYPSRTEALFQQIKADPTKYFRRTTNPSEALMRNIAFELHTDEIFEKLRNE